MITGIEIENFKGIRERVRIDLKPITLLFGANSAGKSSILHAILYGSEVLERRNLDADSTVMGGESIDLGGFKNLVHGHDLDRTVWLRFDLTDEEDYHESLSFRDLPAVNEFFQIPEYFNDNASFFIDPGPISIEIGVSWSSFLGGPFISEYRLYAANPIYIANRTPEDPNEPTLLAAVNADPSGRRVQLSYLNIKHPALCTPDYFDRRVDSENPDELPPLSEFGYDREESILSLCLKECSHCFQSISSESYGEFAAPAILCGGQRDALPHLGKSFHLALRSEYDSDFRSQTTGDDIDHLFAMAREVADELSVILSKPLELVTQYLQRSRYLGPIREVPLRDFQPAKSTDAAAARGRSQWASGRAAWEELARDEKVLGTTNYWLRERLGAGYTIEHQSFVELDLSDPMVIQLVNQQSFDEERIGLDLEARPRGSRVILRPLNSQIELQSPDVGIGISQVVPVIVTAVSGDTGLQIIEQPELHLHPRLQAELGDLFAATFSPADLYEFNRHYESLDDTAKQAYPSHSLQCFLIETHGEHLILRLLRRIRETGKGELQQSVRPLRTNDLAVNYVRQVDGAAVVVPIDVDVKGDFIQPWPDDFFEIDFYERFG